MITVYATYRNSDMIEGRGPLVMDKVFLNEDDANAYITQQEGVNGRKPRDFNLNSWYELGDWNVKPLFVHESLSDIANFNWEDHIKSAYAKLTDEERKAIEFHIRQALT